MTSNATCVSGLEWENNSRGDNPCQVYARLQGECNFTFVVSSVNSTLPPYTPPDNTCGCNYVAYNLMAGCTWCQTGISRNWLTRDQWEGNCTVYSANFTPASITSGVIPVPGWAFLIPQTTFITSQPGSAEQSIAGETWDPIRAYAIASTVRSSSAHYPIPTGYDYGSEHIDPTPLIVGISLGYSLIGLLILSWILGCCAHCQRQTRRRAWYQPTAAYYLAQKGGYGNGYVHAALNTNNPGMYDNPPTTPPHTYPPLYSPSTSISATAFSPLPVKGSHPQHYDPTYGSSPMKAHYYNELDTPDRHDSHDVADGFSGRFRRDDDDARVLDENDVKSASLYGSQTVLIPGVLKDRGDKPLGSPAGGKAF